MSNVRMMKNVKRLKSYIVCQFEKFDNEIASSTGSVG